MLSIDLPFAIRIGQPSLGLTHSFTAPPCPASAMVLYSTPCANRSAGCSSPEPTPASARPTSRALVARALAGAGTAGRRLQAGRQRLPAANGDRLLADDAIQLWEAAGRPGELERVCPQRFAAPLAPHLAARAEGGRVDAKLLRSGLDYWLDRSDIVIVEGVGGLMSPMSDEDYVADLAYELGYPLIVVARNALGVDQPNAADVDHRGHIPPRPADCRDRAQSPDADRAPMRPIRASSRMPTKSPAAAFRRFWPRYCTAQPVSTARSIGSRWRDRSGLAAPSF